MGKMMIMLMGMISLSLAVDDIALPEYHFVPRPLNWMNVRDK